MAAMAQMTAQRSRHQGGLLAVWTLKSVESVAGFSTGRPGFCTGRPVSPGSPQSWAKTSLAFVQVGAALSMVYTSGAPIMFVGCGQTYPDLKRLNVKSVVKSLLK